MCLPIRSASSQQRAYEETEPAVRKSRSSPLLVCGASLMTAMLLVLIAIVSWLGATVKSQSNTLNSLQVRARSPPRACKRSRQQRVRLQPSRRVGSRVPSHHTPLAQSTDVLLTLGLPSVTNYGPYGSLFRGSGTWVLKDSAAEVAAANASWASNGGLSDHAIVALLDQLYLVGGQGIGNVNQAGADSNAPLSKQLWQYDTVYESFTQLAPMPWPVTRHAATIAAGKVFVLGGIGGDAGTGLCWDPTPCPPNGTVFITTGGDANGANPGRTGAGSLVYNISGNSWSQGPRLKVARADACAASIGTKVYVVGGYTDFYNISDAVEVLDASVAGASFALLAPLPQPRGDVSCVASGGLLYVFGGFYDPDCGNGTVGCFAGAQSASGLYNGASKFQNTTFIYNPTSNTWTRGASMRSPRADFGVAALPNGRIVVAGGEHTRRVLDAKLPQHSVELYSVADDAWSEKAPMPYARFRFAMGGVGQAALAFGGQQLCFGSSNNCSLTAANTGSVFYELDHPDVFVQLKGSAGAPTLTGADALVVQ